jgi:aryl-alcohol dehydrogenase-like predicted oxidoreductase
MSRWLIFLNFQGTPKEEIMEDLNDLDRSGKVRYIGASSMAAELKGWAKFISMRDLYNLVMREEEREMKSYCVDAGVACISWSPLATGELTGKKRNTARTESRFQLSKMLGNTQQESNDMIVDCVIELAEKHDAFSAQIALAWLHTKPLLLLLLSVSLKLNNFMI